MSKLEWHKVGERLIEAGVEKGILFPFAEGKYQAGIAWNGLTAVNEQPSGAEPTALWADDMKYLNLMSAEDYGSTIEAYTYPKEFGVCDGSAYIAKGVRIGQQKRSLFGFSYVSKIGNDVEGLDFGYKIHLVYGALASPSEKNRATTNDSPEGMTLSWSVSTTPVEVPGFKPTAHIEIDSTECVPEELAAFEAILYGTDDAESKLPMPDEIIGIFKTSAVVAG